MWLVVEQPGRPGSCALALRLPEGSLVLGTGRARLVLERRRREVTFREEGESSLGTLQNGIRLLRGRLAPGDRLEVGGAALRLERAAPRRGSSPDVLTAGPLPPSDAPNATVRPTPRADPWKACGAFVETLRHAGEPRVLVERLLLGLVDLLGARRAVAVVRRRQGARPQAAAWHGLGEPEAQALAASAAVAQAVERRTLLVLSLPAEERARRRREAPRPRTVVAAPLVVEGSAVGAVWLDVPRAAAQVELETGPAFEAVVKLLAHLVATPAARQAVLAPRERPVGSEAGEAERFVLGEGEAGRRLRELIATAAAQDVTVLVTGETGTGKEMAARAIHRLSSRGLGPFVAVDCAALPHDIIESELFGVERGAFTGATERRLGRFELASGGTLFLDEVGDLPWDLQPKLLRVLQERTVTRLGGQEGVPLDFRLICATNADLEDAVRQGAFRKDLYYRLDVFRLRLPPLRERPEDVLALARHFLELFAARFGRPVRSLSPDAERLILAHPWPGNVRELRNALERAVLVEHGGALRPEALPLCPEGAGPDRELELELFERLPEPYGAARALFDRAFLQRSVRRHGGNLAAVARAAGVPRCTIYRRLKRLGLVPGKVGKNR